MKIKLVLEVDLNTNTEDASRMEEYLYHNMNSAIESGLLDFDDIEVESYSFDVKEEN